MLPPKRNYISNLFITSAILLQTGAVIAWRDGTCGSMHGQQLRCEARISSFCVSQEVCDTQSVYSCILFVTQASVSTFQWELLPLS